ncbi:AlpA family phage regulatory protein [Pseudomonas alkylphenolica]|nr:AlpA family phage regulatory protein [Pseudomonas alkylphenolica]
MNANTLHLKQIQRPVSHRFKAGTLPKQVRIGANSVAWRQSDISIWMSSLTPSNDQSVH